MELKNNQKQGIGLFFAGVGGLLGLLSNRFPKEYGIPVLISSILLYIAGVILLFKSRK
jgi:hypothetical protein